MRKKPDSRDRAEKRSINEFEPVVISAVFYNVSQHTVPSCDQFSAVFHRKFLATIGLTHRRVLYVRWHPEKLTEQVHGFPNMPEYESDGCCVGIHPQGCIFLVNAIERKATREFILLQGFKQDFLLHTLDSSPWDSN